MPLKAACHGQILGALSRMLQQVFHTTLAGTNAVSICRVITDFSPFWTDLDSKPMGRVAFRSARDRVVRSRREVKAREDPGPSECVLSCSDCSKQTKTWWSCG